MAYEDRTFANIIDEALELVSSRFSKREGDIIYDSIAPSALIASWLFEAITFMIEQAFPDTSAREYLVRWAACFGYSPYEATPAIIKVQFTYDEGTVIPENFRLNYKELFYTVIGLDDESEDGKTYLCQCETPGVIGNHVIGTILPVEHLDGLRRADIVGVAINGEDEEDTEDFRERFLASFNADYFGGNLADYLRFTNALPGVGSTKVTRCPRGEGTVDVYILDSEFKPATPELISSVQEAIEPKVDTWPELDYCGLGIAPIGHDVIVRTATTRDIQVGLKLTFDSSHSWEKVQSQLEEKINEYFDELRSSWANVEAITVQAWEIVQAISDIEGIIDISLTSTTMNGRTENIIIGPYEIPVLKGVIESQYVVPEDKPSCPDCPYNRDCINCPRVQGLFD